MRSTALVIWLAALIDPVHGAETWTTPLDIEQTVQRAALVVVVRVADVDEIEVLYGGKTSQSIYQYTFEPVSVLKGVFTRDELKMTSADLRGYSNRFDAREIRPGELRLLPLARSGSGYAGINPGLTAAIAYPPLTERGDPLARAAEVLIALQHEPDRREIVLALSRQLGEVTDRGAVALLAALARRAYIAAQEPAVANVVGRQLVSPSPVAREAAAEVLAAILRADYLGDAAMRRQVVADLVTFLSGDAAPLAARAAAIRALGETVDAVRADLAATGLVNMDLPFDTYAELASRLSVYGRLNEEGGARPQAALSGFLERLPFDAPLELQRTALQAWASIAAGDAPQQLFARISKKKILDLAAVSEIGAFREVFKKLDDPWPLQERLLQSELSLAERAELLIACNINPSPQLASALGPMLNPANPRLRILATRLLLQIDTRDAARALRPHLAEETNLERKLELAAFLGRHGFDDGYAYAVEHLPQYPDAAAAAIAAINRRESVDELLSIYETSNDIRWQHGAVRALGLIGHKPFQDELIDLTDRLTHDLAAPALLARADLGDGETLSILAEALTGVEQDVAIAAAQAAAKLLPQWPDDPSQTSIRDSLATVAQNSRASLTLRRHAIEALVAVEDDGLVSVLSTVLKDAKIERTDLLNRVRELATERDIRI